MRAQKLCTRIFLACSRFDLSERLEEIAVPVLVIASDCDRMVRLNVSLEMAENLKDSYFVSLENWWSLPAHRTDC